MNSTQLPASWKATLDRVASARSSRIHMPAALLIALDILSEKAESPPEIEFADFERRFKSLVAQVRPSAANAAWAPFYHLSTRSGVWKLRNAEEAATFPDGKSPKSRSQLTKSVDRAVMSESLVPAASDDSQRRTVREAIYELLRADNDDESTALVELHAKLLGENRV